MELQDAEEAMGIRKILAHDIRMKKNPQTKKDTFWIFTDFHGNFINCVANPEIVYMLLCFQILSID